MGSEKDAQIKAVDNWDAKCQREGLHCSHCHSEPPYGDRQVFFDTGMCGYCAHALEKDD